MNPIVHIHVLCYNEQIMIPHFLRHYGDVATRIFVYDNMSTDNSLELLTAHEKVTVVPYDTDGEIRDDKYLEIKNNAWKDYDCDVVIVVDMDEFLYKKDLGKYIQEFHESEATIIKPQGFEMMKLYFDITKSKNLVAEVQTGYAHHHFDKLCMFKPKHITDINYNFGCHNAAPQGKVVLYDRPCKLLHYKKIDIDHFLDKMEAYKERMSYFNKALKLGFEYEFDEAKHEANFMDELKKVKKII